MFSNFRLCRSIIAFVTLVVGLAAVAGAADRSLEYRILATSRTSTMEKELNSAAASGYYLSKAMGGRTAVGGQQVVAVMVREQLASGPATRKYKLLAATRTSTIQREIQEAADEGYEYVTQTVFETAFGGKEVVVIMEFDPSRGNLRSSYKLLATSRTSTMEREIAEFGERGYVVVGLTVGETAIGGDEIVAILRKS